MMSVSTGKGRLKIVIGRDGRVSGYMVSGLVAGALTGMGVDVIDAGLSTTPTIEMAVPYLSADAGIVITASHNPGNWNALKLLNGLGEFISDEEGRELIRIAESSKLEYAPVEGLGKYQPYKDLIEMHIDRITGLSLIDRDKIGRAGLKVVVDCVNSTGGISIPPLLERLGVREFRCLFCEPDGQFAHPPEPLPENLTALSEAVLETGADVGFAVDPDVDRLAVVMENGEMFGEEYSLVAVADYVLQHRPGNTVSNLSSTKALKEVTLRRGGEYFASAVGEVNVVKEMKERRAVIGGEGNGGIILPELHYGRDALVGIALFLTFLAEEGTPVSALKKRYPEYYISKKKIGLTEGMDPEDILTKLSEKYRDYDINTSDGLRIDMEEEWVHLRLSNTEPIIRIYAESRSSGSSEALAERFIDEIAQLKAR